MRVVSPVSLNVAGDLGDPIGRVVPALQPRKARIEIAAVPEITVAEHYYAGTNKHDVGPTRELVDMQAVSQPSCPQRLA